MSKIRFAVEMRNWTGAGLVILVACVFNFWRLGSLPPGLDGDAAANGLVALRWLYSGVVPFWIPIVTLPEPLMMWLQTFTTWLLGPSIPALRSVSAAATVAAALGVYCLGLEVGRADEHARAFWGALLAGLTAAANIVWSEIGRTGLRASLLPVFQAFLFLALLVGLRTGDKRCFLYAGLLFGGAAYTYLSARFLLLVVILFLGTSLFLWPDLRSRSAGIGIMFAVATLVVLPQLVFFLRYPEFFMGRASAVTLTHNALYAQVGLWGLLWQKLVSTLSMFGVAWSGQFNQSSRPLLQPLAFAGLLLALPALARRKLEAGSLLIALTLPVMLLPDFLSDRIRPHSIRVIGIFVPTHVLAGLGLAEALAWLPTRARIVGGQRIGACLALGLVAWSLVDGYVFVSPRILASNYHWYQRPEVAEADFINSTDRPVVLPLLEYSRSTLHYLSSQRARKLAGGIDPSGLTHRPAAGPVYFLWPADVARVRPEGSSYRFDPAALIMIEGDHVWLLPPADPGFWLKVEAYPAADVRTPTGQIAARAYTVPFELFDIQPNMTLTWPVDRTFANRLRLLGVSANPVLASGSDVGVTSYWEAMDRTWDDLVYAVQILDDAQQLRASENLIPAYGAYQTNEWRPGQIIPLRQPVKVPADLPPGRYWLLVTLYDRITGRRVGSVDTSGNPADNSALVGPLKVPLHSAGDLPEGTLLSAELSDEFALRGYRVQMADRTHLGVSLQLEAVSRPEFDYTFFVHVDSAMAKVVAQADVQPLDGTYPTTIWDPGERVVVNLVVNLPPDFPAGEYTLWAGAYYWATGQRLSLYADGREIDENRLLLQTITISQ